MYRARAERDDDEFMVLIKRALPIGRFATRFTAAGAKSGSTRPLVHYTLPDGWMDPRMDGAATALYGVIAKSGSTRGMTRAPRRGGDSIVSASQIQQRQPLGQRGGWGSIAELVFCYWAIRLETHFLSVFLFLEMTLLIASNR